MGAFYQSGYLTIKNFDGEYYRPGLSQQGVEEGFTKFIVPYYVGKSDAGSGGSSSWKLMQATRCLPDAHPPSAGLGGRRYAAQSGGTQLPQYAVPALQGDGVEVRMEEPTSAGHALTWWCGLTSTSAVMEFKLNQRVPKRRCSQITDKHYADSYLGRSPAGVPHRRELCQRPGT